MKPRVVFHSSAEPVPPPPCIHPPTTNYLTYNYHRLKPHSSLGDFVVYGGMGLDNMSAASDLCQLRLKGESQIYVDVTLMKQHDDVLSARFGHKMTKIDEQSVLMHGGLSLDLRSSDHFVQDTFRQVLSDQHFNILGVASKTWSKLGVKAHCARAFHSAGFLTRILYPSFGGSWSHGSLGPRERIHRGQIMEVTKWRSLCVFDMLQVGQRCIY